MKLFVATLLALAPFSVNAETLLFGGRAQIGVEFEREREAHGRGFGNSVTLFPGIVWKEGWITRAELLLMSEREKESGVSSNVHAFGVRLRKDVHFTEDFGGFLRALVGHKSDADSRYNYGYVEPALVWEIDPIELYAGYRLVRALDGSSGHDINQLRFGPGWDFSSHHGVDVRYTYSRAAGSGSHVSDAIEVEYTYRF